MDIAIATLYTLNALNSESSLPSTDWSSVKSAEQISPKYTPDDTALHAFKLVDSVASPEYLKPPGSCQHEALNSESNHQMVCADGAESDPIPFRIVDLPDVPAASSEPAVLSAPNVPNATTTNVPNEPKQILTTQVPIEPVFTRPTPPRTQLRAFNLVGMAYQGYFQTQSIPRYGRFMDAIKSRRVTANDLVRAAIASGRLSAAATADDNYLHAVNIHLRGLIYGNNYRGRR